MVEKLYRIGTRVQTRDLASLMHGRPPDRREDVGNVGGEKIDLVCSGFIAKSGEVKGRAIHAITPAGLKMLKKARDHYGVSGDDLMVAIAEGRFVGGRVVARRRPRSANVGSVV